MSCLLEKKSCITDDSFVLDKLQTKNGSIWVVRDDLLLGGTKQRAAIPFVSFLRYQGITECIYASPFCGFAQVAIAHACKKTDVKCTIFAEQNHTTNSFSDVSNSIRDIADTYLFETLELAELAATNYSDGDLSCRKIPLGLNNSVFKSLLIYKLKILWSKIQFKLGFSPSCVWVPVGSGTLAKTLRQVIHRKILLKCVDVHVLSEQDNRIIELKRLQNIEYISAPEKFLESAKILPPIPSNKFYDAKLWQFINNFSVDREVWWNVSA